MEKLNPCNYLCELHVLHVLVDIDRSGFLEYSEFVIAALGEKECFRHDNLKKAFHQFDTESRGYITKTGLHHALSTFLSDKQDVDDAMIRKIVKEVDRNGTLCFSVTIPELPIFYL